MDEAHDGMPSSGLCMLWTRDALSHRCRRAGRSRADHRDAIAARARAPARSCSAAPRRRPRPGCRCRAREHRPRGRRHEADVGLGSAAARAVRRRRSRRGRLQAASDGVGAYIALHRHVRAPGWPSRCSRARAPSASARAAIASWSSVGVDDRVGDRARASRLRDHLLARGRMSLDVGVIGAHHGHAERPCASSTDVGEALPARGHEQHVALLRRSPAQSLRAPAKITRSAMPRRLVVRHHLRLVVAGVRVACRPCSRPVPASESPRKSTRHSGRRFTSCCGHVERRGGSPWRA